MGKITRYFRCENKNCKIKPKWSNDKHQAEEQECYHCHSTIEPYQYDYEGRLFGKFWCDRCKKHWFSGNASHKKWQQCQKCSTHCFPVMLREHDIRDSDEELESEEEVERPHPHHLCQRCQELKELYDDPDARCVGVEYGKKSTSKNTKRSARKPKVLPAKNEKTTATKPPMNEPKKTVALGLSHLLQYNFSNKESRLNMKIKNENPFEMKAEADFQNQVNSYDDDWFYTANLPYRMLDYKMKLESGQVTRSPLHDPYRQMYFENMRLIGHNQRTEFSPGFASYQQSRKYRQWHEADPVKMLIVPKTTTQAKASDKSATKKDNGKPKEQKKSSKKKDDDDEYWDSEDEYDRNNWFYFANDVYEDAPFRLVDYQEKLEAGLVKESPECDPYRKMYKQWYHAKFVKMQKNAQTKSVTNAKKQNPGTKQVAPDKTAVKKDQAKPKKQKKSSKKKDEPKTGQSNTGEAKKKKRKRNRKKAAKTTDDNKENARKTKNQVKKGETGLEAKMKTLTISSSQQATRTSTGSRRVLSKLG
ncbi:Oidioi.mRNA.OKI2018_I69.chr1.g3431.t1.cds [Oikopleura dioica]|uniref:Oidioi.mRNA.OKI2018_I69.chr1.g3431.t1.cds n=1 Tax=Oikopleura dioica TaxID=34765 RepID=A0ABN7SU28_OIKDI|nr:Oidioi.mRNA.OKI2018_I69.chr1.g3431.t1.cds [Oikopleura dioica]